MCVSQHGFFIALASRSGVTTRQISAENPTGARNGGARSLPDPGSGSAHLGAGFKASPFRDVNAGETIDLARISGAGMITHLFLTSELPDLQDLRLRMYWDNEPAPSVDVEVASFFSVAGPGQSHVVASLPVTVGPTRGCTAYWAMPFHNGARVTLTNTGAVDARIIAYKITYEPHDSDKGVSASRFCALTKTGKPNPVSSEFDLVAAAGAGRIVGTTLRWRAIGARWWGEGEVKVYFGDDEFPTLVDTGTEDYFGGAWGFGRDAIFLPSGPIGETPFCGPHAGVPYIDRNEGYVREIQLYRWNLADPIGFSDGVRMAIQSIGNGADGRLEVRNDELTATGFWYRDGE